MYTSDMEGWWKMKRMFSGQNISDAQSMEAAGIAHLLLLINTLMLRRSINIFHPQPPAFHSHPDDSEHTVHHLRVQNNQKLFSLLLRLLLLLEQHLHLLLDVLQVLQQVHVPAVLAGRGLPRRLRMFLLLLLHPQQLQSPLFLLRKFLKTVVRCASAWVTTVSTCNILTVRMVSFSNSFRFEIYFFVFLGTKFSFCHLTSMDFCSIMVKALSSSFSLSTPLSERAVPSRSLPRMHIPFSPHGRQRRFYAGM